MTKYEEKAVKLARKYYNILKRNVKVFNATTKAEFKSFEKFCDYLGGHNFEWWNEEQTEGLFDLNFGNICATIIYKNGKCRLATNVEVWGEDIIFEDYEMEQNGN